MTRCLLSGAGGFWGHHCFEHVLTETDWDVVATDSFRHPGKTDRITQVLDGREDWRERVTVITHDLTAPFSAQAAARIAGPGLDYVIAAASESHVDRSIADPVPFMMNNTAVMLNTLELARVTRPQAVVVISTDEVYGSETGGITHPEWDVILPSNVYSASKAAQEAAAISYWRTYGVPVIIVNCVNLLGERQDAEKFIPMVIRAVLRGEQVTVHGADGDIGTRYWLHCRNLADGITFLLGRRPPVMFPFHAVRGAPRARRPDRYNIACPDRISNLELAQMIAGIMGRPLDYRLEGFPAARPGHDPHYGLDTARITALGWRPPVPFAESLERTVKWTAANPAWLI